jgi:hypothetical protein
MKWVYWIFLSVLFFAMEIYQFDSENIVSFVVEFVVFVTFMWWFFIPFVMGERMRVPGYAFELEKGEDDLLRFLSFSAGTIVLLTIFFT